MARSSTTFTSGHKGLKKKGTPNKVTASVRGMVKTLVENNLEQVQDDLDRMDPISRVAAITKLLDFTIPKLKSTEMKYDLSVLSDAEVDTLFNKIVEASHNG